jgi:hypothetical protein
MDSLDKALANAVHAIANKRLQGAVNAAKAAVKNPTPQNQAALQRNLQAAETPVRLATQLEQRPVNTEMQKNVNRLLKLIEERALNTYINKPNFNITKNPNYNNSRKANINQAIQRRKINLGMLPPLPSKPTTNSEVNAIINNIQKSKNINENAIRSSDAYKRNSQRINSAIRARKAAMNPFPN